jgi:hypothetical protein
VSNGDGGCAGDIRKEQPIGYSVKIAVGSPTSVYGFAPNNVTGVQVEMGASLEDARLANNIFYYETSADYTLGEIIPSALIVTFTDGSVTRIDQPELPNVNK